MKKAIIITLCTMFLFGCSKKNDNRITSSSIVNFRFVKYWKQDTLTAGIGYYPGIDTLFTYISSDTSFIVYHNKKLYIFYLSLPSTTHNTINCDDSMIEYQGYISPIAFDTAAAWTSVIITPYTYWDASRNGWYGETQSLLINQLYPHFDTSAFMGFYQ